MGRYRRGPPWSRPSPPLHLHLPSSPRSHFMLQHHSIAVIPHIYEAFPLLLASAQATPFSWDSLFFTLIPSFFVVVLFCF